MAELTPPLAYDELSKQAINSGHADLLKGIQRGIEKEGLRVTADGHIAQTLHPHCLGAALTHPHITTDYSEALIELITLPHNSTQEALDELLNIHRWVYHCIGDELVWPGSMPSRLQGEKSIPIAEYGDSNQGKMKHVYRRGLAWRYGRIMQSIAGIHYNFSLPSPWWEALYTKSGTTQPLQDFISAGYIALLRNFRRHAWLLTYLFGASPALDKSFMDGREHQLDTFDEDTLYLPYATCLRMTDLGYKSEAQSAIWVCYNYLDTYVDTLSQALNIEYAPYKHYGVKVDGEYRQLNTNLLQIENEYYSEVRPKRTPRQGEKPLEALRAHGIEYIEVRLLDLNPFLPLGLDETQVRFLDTFLLHCLLKASPGIDDSECKQINSNLFQVAQRGRDPELSIEVGGRRGKVADLARLHLEEMQSTAKLLDEINQTDHYSQALNAQLSKLNNPDLLPSQQLLQLMREEQLSYAEAMLKLSRQHWSELKQPLINGQTEHFRELAASSHQRQAAIEADSTADFDEYLANYFQQPD